MEENREWNGKILRTNAWGTAFKKGLYAWFLLVVVVFIFMFFGVEEGASTVDAVDGTLGIETEYVPDAAGLLTQYVLTPSFQERFPLLNSEILAGLINAAAKSEAWIIELLAANFAYFKRNEGEVIVILFLTAILSFLIKFVLQNIFALGEKRYVMENRFQKETQIKRIFAPFHRKDLLNEIKVMFVYHITLLLWLFTVVGFFYKGLQYCLVPYIVAENPQVSWKEARALSTQMTDGYKWKMFKTKLGAWYILIFNAVPLVNNLFSKPYEVTLDAEMYFQRRAAMTDRTFFVEKAFDGERYVSGDPEEKTFLMEDVIKSPQVLRQNVKTDIKRLAGSYSIYDYIIFFFAFCFVGWLWEVGLHLVKDHMFVNRGTMYGPWLPIYGVGGVVILFLLDRFKANKWKLFLSAVALCAVLEFASSWALDYFNNASYWDYKNMFLNLNGRICFAGLMAFGLGGMFGVYVVAPRLSLLLDKLGKKKTQILCSILVALFGCDLVCCAIFGLNSGAGIGESYESS